MAGTLKQAIQNPGAVSKFAKDLQGQLTEPPDGLCKVLKDSAKNLMLQKVLPEVKPFLEEAFKTHAGLNWQQVEDIVVRYTVDQKITLADLKEARKNPKVVVERLVKENIIELLRRVLEPIIQSEPELQGDLKLSWSQIEPVLARIDFDELMEGLKNPRQFVKAFVQNHLPELLRPKLEPVFASLNLTWDNVELVLEKITMRDCTGLLEDSGTAVKLLVKTHIVDLLTPILQPLVNDNTELRKLDVDWVQVQAALAPHSGLATKSLRDDLKTLKFSELRRRAKASGVSTEALAAVDDMIGHSSS